MRSAMIICVCRKINEEEILESSKKIQQYFPELSTEKKMEIFNAEYGQPICGLCREHILASLKEEH